MLMRARELTTQGEEQWFNEMREQMIRDLWRADKHGAHHLRQLHCAGGTPSIMPLSLPGHYIGLTELGSYTALGLSVGTDRDEAALLLAAAWAKQEARIVIAPEPLAMALRSAWQGGADIYTTDQYLSRVGDKKPPVAELPIVSAREILPVSADVPEQLAHCWLRYKNEWHKPEAFASLLQQSDALCWLEEGRVKAFQVFNELGNGQLFLGRTCGPAAEAQAVFGQLACRKHNHRATTLSTCVDVSNGPALDRLQRAGFTLQPGHRFTTLVLS
jgi:hypothetical protein